MTTFAMAFDRAIALYRQGSYDEARVALEALSRDHPAEAMVWDALGYLERDDGRAAAAAKAFDRALAVNAADDVALRGRSRIALERAEPDTLRFYAAARRAAPNDPHLFLEEIEARLSLGDEAALAEFARVASQVPAWTEGQIALGRMLWETRRDSDYAAHIRKLLREQPNRLDLWTAFVDLLARCEDYAGAANAARDARAATDNAPALRLVEAVYAGRAGDVDRAEALLSDLPADLPGRAIHDAVHHIRRNEPERARDAIEHALANDDTDITAWGIAELIYRKLGDPKSAWLIGPVELVRTLDLPLSADRFTAIRNVLLDLARHGVAIAGQSVRGGTQTRWRLFDRLEPELAELKQAFEAMIEAYRSELPPAEPAHPLLRHRDAPLRITGSWSVRLTGSGHHVSHIHHLGVLSSASYFVVPHMPPGSTDGYLEIGRPSPDFHLDLEPIRLVRPMPGQLTLFPSYLHHGTRPFAAGERLSVAFDVGR